MSFGVAHGHLAYRVDEQLTRLRHGLLRGPVERNDELVRVLAHAEAPHELFGSLRRLRKRNAHIGIAEEAVGSAERLHGRLAPLLEGRAQCRRSVGAGEALELRRRDIGP
jgi:hypothetical protein